MLGIKQEHQDKLFELLGEATEAVVANRGHVLNHTWTVYISSYRLTAYIECVKCGKGVQVNTNPLPNQIDIGGEAVAVGCID